MLEQNYRSTKSIVDSANRLIGFNTNRIEKKCFSGGDEGCPIEFIEADTDRSEAKYIIQTIKITRLPKEPGYHYALIFCHH